MSPYECLEMVTHNEQHELHTRNESRFSPIRMSPYEYLEMNGVGGPARPPSYRPDQESPSEVKGRVLEDPSRPPEQELRNMLLLCTGTSE
ncbi:hypothetical protein NDU88_002784 [Pleurodeles waltl]|uniref:Uncharacterized protein n=1 Tax=Pleurodeles waltl TaxID=8319 RepID=A0AAV7V0Q4_PLEWA|nr:hypothetical protein NDU88_002784 [Pleurodeles waltl]